MSLYTRLEDVPKEVRIAYAEGWYRCGVPAVSTLGWGELDWINFIGPAGFLPTRAELLTRQPEDGWWWPWIDMAYSG